MKLSIVIYILALTTSGYCFPDLRIVGGNSAKDGQFPYQASLKRIGVHSCGGAILNAKWILTSAKCIEGNNAELTVAVGTNSFSRGTTYNSEKSIFHQDYNLHTFENDIALVKLETPLEFNAKVQPIALSKEDIPVGAGLTLSGWGRTDFPGNTPNTLQYIILTSISMEECASKHATTGFGIYDTQICTFNDKGQGVCLGDEGSPLVYNGKVVGIASWQRPCAVGYPDVFTRVSKYIDWIENTMKNY